MIVGARALFSGGAAGGFDVILSSARMLSPAFGEGARRSGGVGGSWRVGFSRVEAAVGLAYADLCSSRVNASLGRDVVRLRGKGSGGWLFLFGGGGGRMFGRVRGAVRRCSVGGPLTEQQRCKRANGEARRGLKRRAVSWSSV